MATSSSYLLKIGADVGSVTKSIAQINGDIRSLANQSRNLNSAFKLTGDTSILTKNISVLEKQLTATQNKSKSLKSQLASMQASPGFDANSVKAQKLTRDIETTESQAVKLKAELANAKTGGLDEISTSADKASHSLGVGKIALGSFLGSLATSAVTAFASVLGKAFEGVGQDIITASDGIQKFQSTMKFAGKSGNEIAKLTTASKKYADDTVYDLTDVLNTTAQLGANGVQNYGKMVQASGNLNAVAGGNADTFKSVAMVLTQTAGAGKLTTENWNQLADAIPGASGKLQEAMKKNGAFTGNFRDAMANGQITADEFNKAIMQLGMTDVAKQAATSTNTFEGAFGNLQASFVTAGLDFVNKFKQPITDGMTAIANAVPGITNALSGVIGFLGQFGGMIAQSFSGLAPVITQAFSGISGIIGSLTSSGNQIQTLFTTISTTISGILGTMDFSALTNLAQAILPALQAGFQTFLGYVTPAIQPLLTAFVNLWNAIQPIVNVIASSLMPVFQILGAFLGGFVSGVMGALTTAFNVLAGVARVLTPVIQFVGSVIQALAPIFVTVAGFIGQLMGQFAVFNGILGLVGKVVSSVFSGIIGFGSRLFSSLSGVFNNIANGFRIMGSGLGGVGRGIANTFRSIIGFAGRMVSGIIGAVSGVAGRIASHFSGVFGAISSAIGNVTSIGTNIVNGIAQGIKGAWKSIASVLSSLTDMIPKKIRALLGIHSPSRVMRDMVGKFIPQGIAVGMTSQDGFISRHAQTLKDQLTSSMSNISLPSVGLAGGSLATAGTSTSTTSNQVTINVNGSNPDLVVPQIKRELRRVGLSTN
ncbi:tail length tape-measure protein [Leuconostoc phage P965]|uniref:Tail length tape-measure protein n=1 Tax=Leuconostoc phage P965 TaxID=2662299 RepID=A0A649V4B9_9CAUD|nr:tail length tape-measure protein [Leuconostoc phage P965]QGJ85066.1 tail length tape-measure protein [Leuconostoc phage P965]